MVVATEVVGGVGGGGSDRDWGEDGACGSGVGVGA